jgi:hypothetical protein
VLAIYYQGEIAYSPSATPYNPPMRTDWTPAHIAFAEQRDAWLAATVATLRADGRFVAAWLAGSFGRGEADHASDLDLHVVVSEAAGSPLLDKPQQTQAGATPARLALFAQFGAPVIVHENHWNAICDGTFTYVRYARLVKVDWQLIPVQRAERPHHSHLLFAHQEIPVSPEPALESPDEQRATLKEQTAFFWLMLDTACNYLMRRDWSALVTQLRHVDGVAFELERVLSRRPSQWQARVGADYAITSLEPQHAASVMRRMASRVSALHPALSDAIGEPLSDAQGDAIERLLRIAEQ